MVIESLYELNDKNGSSLQAIRKYIENNLVEKGQQAATFNTLTKKAIDSAVASNRIEKLKKNSYRLSAYEKEKKREEEFGFEVSQKEKVKKKT